MKINLRSIATKELGALAKRVIEASKSGNFTVVENNELLVEIENQYAIYQKVYSKKAFSGKGDIVAEADRKRDEIYSDLKAFLAGYRRIKTMPNAQDAEDLYQIFKDFGLGLDRYSYLKESAQLDNLILELEKEPNKAKLTTLGLADTFTALKMAQTEFETLYNEQAEANADLHNLPTATELRRDLEKALRNYFNLLTAMKQVPNWELIYEEINEIVKGARNSKQHISG